MTKEFLYKFIQKNNHAVLATVSSSKIPEAALVGLVVLPDLKVFFDTTTNSRKYANLVHNPSVAFVIGWDGEQTLQYEGVASIPKGEELEILKKIYFKAFPDGKKRAKWKNIAYFCVEPKWIRSSDFHETEPQIEEIAF